jgi:hypothetical protein
MRSHERVFGILCIALLVGLCGTPSLASDEEPDTRTVTASGSAVVGDADAAGARSRALLDAKRNAVEQVGTKIVSETIVENFAVVKDKIITKADGYVHKYRVLKEAQSEGRYLLDIEAEVSGGAIREDALSVYHKMNKPRVMVVMPETRDKDGVSGSHAEDVVSEFFIGKEFTLVDAAAVKEKIRKDEMRKVAEGDPKAAAKMGLDAGAEVVVVGSATSGSAQGVRDVMYASKATCSARAINTANASLYAASSTSKSAADGIADGARRKAVDTTCRSVAKDIFWKIVKKWNEELVSGSSVEIALSGVNFSLLKKVIEAVKKLEGVSDVVQRSFDSPTAVLTVNYKGDPIQLADILDRHRYEGFMLEVLTVSAGKINLKAR